MPSCVLEQIEKDNKQTIIKYMDAPRQTSPVDLPAWWMGGWARVLPTKNHCY